ncbi:Uncharacterised protein [uncultured archaeon]|nr:Uncharacterised protein [uncultured archaeon]
MLNNTKNSMKKIIKRRKDGVIQSYWIGKNQTRILNRKGRGQKKKNIYECVRRRVFFSFHYERDAIRAAQVRNSNVVKNKSIEASDFIDAAKWEEVKRCGEEAIKRWIENQISGTSVTAVLIGAKTSERKWIKHEIDESLKRGNGLLAIYIHKCPLFDGRTDTKGKNPFDNLSIEKNGQKKYLSEIYSAYDWFDDNGRENLGYWIEEAARKAGR